LSSSRKDSLRKERHWIFVVELGPTRFTSLKKGFEVPGIDISSKALEYAKEKA
jgi:hypothetical protein